MFELKSTYLNTAYMGPLPLKAKQNVEEILLKCLDPSQVSFEDRVMRLENLRSSFAGLLDVPADNIAFSSSCAELVSHVANGMDFKTGDNVVLLEGDFPSMILPWMLAAENRGIQLRRIPLSRFLDGSFKSELNSRTKLVACSHVLFNSGIQMPIAAIGDLARKHGALMMADVSQSFGGMPIHRDILNNVDILVGVGYKWLLGPYGNAFGYFNERALREIRRTHAAWAVSATSANTENLLNYTLETLPGARKFDRGESSTYLIVAGLQGALDLIKEKGLANIHKHNSSLVDDFLDNLPKSIETLTPRDRLSNIVCIKPLNEDGQALKSRLTAKNIQVSIREGAIRLSFHFFNTSQDVETVLKEIHA